MILFWALLIVAVVVLDMITSNILYSWMGIGFLSAIAASVMGFGIPVQIIAACIVGAIAFVFGSFVSRTYIRHNLDNTPILTDKIVGTLHTADIEIDQEVQYKINGIYWLLRNDGPVIKPGDEFRIIGIKNNRLHVIKEN